MKKKMRQADVAIVFASALVLMSGLAGAKPLNQISMTTIEAGQQSCTGQSSFIVAAAEKDQAPAKEQSPPGDVQERALPRVTPGVTPSQRMAPGGQTAAPLTKAECTGLGCKAVTDTTCKDVGGLRERCVCGKGTAGLCIDMVK
jgi:hypothetical protein